MWSKVSAMFLSAFSVGREESGCKPVVVKNEHLFFKRTHPLCRWQLCQSIDPQSSRLYFHWIKRRAQAS